jgi:hypothetical protein
MATALHRAKRHCINHHPDLGAGLDDEKPANSIAHRHW